MLYYKQKMYMQRKVDEYGYEVDISFFRRDGA